MRSILFILFLSNVIFCQINCPPDTTGYQVVRELTICWTKVESNVSYHPECSCYYYNYNIISPENNKGVIAHVETMFSTIKSYFHIDSSLPYDEICDITYSLSFLKFEKHNYIPISFLSCPPGWNSTGHAGIWAKKAEAGIKPGQSASFAIASKFPPGKRKIKLLPEDNDIEWELVLNAPEEGWMVEDADPPYALGDFYAFDIDVPGPVDPEELDLFNGGGQKPDDVNLFLRYASPLQSQTELPSGTSSFDVFIYYGKTIKPETFKATLNDVDIKNLFTPVPNGGDYVKINLKNGRNVLEFSIDGTNKNGQVANDKDRLVLIVK